MHKRHPAASASPDHCSQMSRRGLLTAGTALTAMTTMGAIPPAIAVPVSATSARETEAGAVTLVDANVFDILAPIHVSYSRSSITGVPLVIYKDTERELSFRGKDIVRISTARGELVTVILEDAVDAFVRTFTLIVPTVRVPFGEDVEFQTLGIETTDYSSAFVLPPPGPSGALETYRAHQLHGTARQFVFSTSHTGVVKNTPRRRLHWR